MARLIGIDYGRARIGVSYSDESKFLSSPLFVCKKQKKVNYSFEEIKNKISHLLPVETIVVGLPLLLNLDLATVLALSFMINGADTDL